MSRSVSIALIQPPCELGNTALNISHAVALCGEAAAEGAQLICLPELFNTGYNLKTLGHNTVKYGLEAYQDTVDHVSECARKNNCYIVCPIVEPTSMPGVAYNSALLIDNQGKLAGRYAKTHLFGLEKEHFTAGDQIPVFDTPFGKLGLLICYDMGFPETARSLCLRGVELLIIPAAWPTHDEDLWELNLRQRALENNIFVAGINCSQQYDGLHLFGKSTICNPRGTIVNQMDSLCGFQTTTIDLNDISRFREKIPYLRDRKPHLYH